MMRNMTRMVMSSLFFNAFGQTPYAVCFVVQQFIVVNEAYNTATQIAFMCILFAPALEFFFYYSFNKLFKSVFDGYFKTAFCCRFSKSRF